MKNAPAIGIAILMIVILILCEFVEIVSWQEITSSHVKKEVIEASIYKSSAANTGLSCPETLMTVTSYLKLRISIRYFRLRSDQVGKYV